MANMAQNEYEMESTPIVTQETANSRKLPEEVHRPSSAHSSTTAREPVTTELGPRFYPILAFAFYTIIALLAWIFACVLSKRPIRGTNSYTGQHGHLALDLDGKMAVNEKYIMAMRALQAITTLLTIPVTCALCSMALAVYMQAGTMRKSLNVRQLIALADQGWISPRVWSRLAVVGSVPMGLAFVLTLIGCVSQVLQHTFYDQEAIKVANYFGEKNTNIKDIPSMFTEDRVGIESGERIYTLRGMLSTVAENDFESNMWTTYTSYYSRTYRMFDHIYSEDEEAQSLIGQSFVAELPSNFSTGAVGPQYAPRLHTRTTYDNISAETFSNSCSDETDNGGFFAEYKQPTYYDDDTDNLWYGITICMPGDKRVPVWKPTRDLQNTFEEMYLNFTYYTTSRYYRATANTTLGYFELPYYGNGNTAGPVLEKDPLHEGMRQWHKNIFKREVPNVTYAGNQTLVTNNHNGPLTALALALFGQGSFIEQYSSRPEAYAIVTEDDDNNDGIRLCNDVYPLGNLLRLSCIKYRENVEAVYGAVWNWVEQISSESQFSYALQAGVFLANKAYLGPSNYRSDQINALMVFSDPGFDTFKPKMSDTQILVGSVLLGVHLLGLLALALYAALMKSWVTHLGAEAMMKVGTFYSANLTSSSRSQWKKTASGLPGYIGDARPDDAVGRMSMGAEARLRGGKRYEVLK